MTNVFDFPLSPFRRRTVKEQELILITKRFQHWVDSFPSTSLEEDEFIESIGDSLAALAEILSSGTSSS